jgi:hypothetical protein
VPGECSVTGGVMEEGGELAFDIESSPGKGRFVDKIVVPLIMAI